MVASQIDPGVEPGLGVDRRHVRPLVNVVTSGEGATLGEGRELLGIPLLDHAEAAELAFNPIEVAMVVGVADDETVAADVITSLHPFDDMHRKG